MSSPSDIVPGAAPRADLPGRATASVAPTPTRPFFWSVRRELWENGSIWIAPLSAAGVILVGFLLALANLPGRVPSFGGRGGVRHALPPKAPYGIVAVVLLVTAIIVGVFYCLGALNAERRDRTILFWKSLPVSDLTTVAAKAFIPLVVLPIVAFVVAALTQGVILGLSAASAAASGSKLAALMTDVPFFSMLGVLAYTAAVVAIWYAPVWGWCLLVGAWARRVAFLWAVAPPLAICVIERIAFGSSFFAHLIGSRLNPPLAAFSAPAQGRMVIDLGVLDPVGFLTSPGLWLGLAAGAGFAAAAVWVRRYRDPI